MKNNIRKYAHLLTLTALMISFSCADELETEPRQSVSTQQALVTRNDFYVALAGAYAQMLDQLYYGRNVPALADASSDNGKIPAGAGARLTVFYTMALNPTNTAGGSWDQIYFVISQVNNIINAIDNVTGASELEKNQIKGEALFLRALGHHDLVKIFAHDYNYTADASHDGVPYIKETVIGEPSRASVKVVYDNLIADLDQAVTLLTGSSRTTPDKADFASAMAAKALRARVNLFRGNYGAALADANDVIDNGGYVLADYIVRNPDNSVNLNAIASWSSRTPTSESIFQLEADPIDAQWPGLEGLASIYQRDDGYGDLGPNNDIVSLYGGTDVRRNWYVQQGGVWFVEKYPGQGGNAIAFTFPVLRLTEMYLIKAECHARLDADDDDALATINAIRARANVAPLASTGDQLLADILTERRRELAFEGHRYFDLKRLQQDIVRNDCDLSENCVIPYGDRLFAYPIPQPERDANPNMSQNPDY